MFWLVHFAGLFFRVNVGAAKDPEPGLVQQISRRLSGLVWIPVRGRNVSSLKYYTER